MHDVACLDGPAPPCNKAAMSQRADPRSLPPILAGKEFAAPSVFEPAKLLRVGEQPVKLATDAYYNAIRKTGGNDTWVTQLTLTFLFPD